MMTAKVPERKPLVVTRRFDAPAQVSEPFVRYLDLKRADVDGCVDGCAH